MLREAAEGRKNKLASSEYDETTWAAVAHVDIVCVAADLRGGAARDGAGGGGGSRVVGGGRPPGAVSSGSRPMNAGPRSDLPLPPHATAQYMLASVCR